ncbi:MAG: hypothetical protein ACPGWR_25700 [Ardenticatenaceae bacterium]
MSRIVLLFIVAFIHRLRLVLVVNGIKIVIYVSPWDLKGWGILPDLVIKQDLHAASNEAYQEYKFYVQRAKQRLRKSRPSDANFEQAKEEPSPPPPQA